MTDPTAPTPAGGGLVPARLDQAYDAGPARVIAPGGAAGTFRGRLVIIYTQGPGSGLFMYNGQPKLGNPPVLAVTLATTDPYGNTITPGVTFDNVPTLVYSGPPAAGNLLMALSAQAGTDSFGNAYPVGMMLSGPSGSGQMVLNPLANKELDITTTVSGFLQQVTQLTTSDGAEVVSGYLGSLLLGSGAATKMATAVTSPFGSTGAALLLQAENDGGTDTALISMGLITTPDSGTTVVYTPIAHVSPYAFLLYGGTGGQAVVTFTSGSGNFPQPAGVTAAKVECWGPGSGAANGGTAAAGGAGEYAAEPNLTLAALNAYSVGSGGSGGAGAFSGNPGHLASGATTFAGASVTVTANRGGAGGGIGPGSGGAGGTGSTNTVHFNGGAGGDSRGLGGNPGIPNGGCGGGSSGGMSSAGNPGQVATSNAGAPGGAAVSGGGAGGTGGHGGSTSHTPGSAGASPGGGGAGGGFNPSNSFCEAGGTGSNGQIRITYSTGTPPILFSVAAAAGTDQFGTSYPAGPYFALAGVQQQRIPSAGAATFPGTTVTAATLTTIASATYPASDATAGAVYELEVWGNGVTGSTLQTLEFAVSFGGNVMASFTFGTSALNTVSQAFRWCATARVICHTTGALGTWTSYLLGNVTEAGVNIAPGNNNFGQAFSCESSSTTTVDTTVNETLALQVAWGAVTGAPTLTSRVAIFKRIA